MDCFISPGKESMNQSQIEQFAQQLLKAMPKDVMVMKTDLEQHLKSALSATFSKMDLVSREEFDVQSRLLSRTRQRLEEIQKRVDELENQNK